MSRAFSRQFHCIPLALMGLLLAWGVASAEPESKPDEKLDDIRWQIDVPWYKTAKVADRNKVRTQLALLLNQDWSDSAGVEKAEEHFATAHGLCETDPRILYAYGLVLWRHNRRDKAATRFEEAQQVRGVFFLPAYPASISARLEQGRWTEALKSAKDLAGRLQKSEGKTLQDAEQQRVYEWLGSVCELLEHANISAAERTELSRLVKSCQATEDAGAEDAAAAFVQGREKHRALLRETSAADGDVRKFLQTRLSTVQKDYGATQTKLATEQDALDKVRNEAQETQRTEQSAQQEVSRLKLQCKSFVERARSAEKEKLVAQAELNRATKIITSKIKVEEKIRTDKATGEDIFRLVDKTVRLEVTKSISERERDAVRLAAVVAAIASAHASADKLRPQIKMLEMQRKSDHEAAVAARDEFAQSAKASTIAAHTRRRDQLGRELRRLDAWIEHPESFRTAVKTTGAIDDWNADDDRAALCRSLGMNSPVTMQAPVARSTSAGEGSDTAFEGEQLRILSVAAGETSVQEMREFEKAECRGGKQMLWSGVHSGDRLELQFEMKHRGRYLLQAKFTMSPEYATIQLEVDGRALGDPLDLRTSDGVLTTGELSFGEISLTEGWHTLAIVVTTVPPDLDGKAAVGFDFLRIVSPPPLVLGGDIRFDPNQTKDGETAWVLVYGLQNESERTVRGKLDDGRYVLGTLRYWLERNDGLGKITGMPESVPRTGRRYAVSGQPLVVKSTLKPGEKISIQKLVNVNPLPAGQYTLHIDFVLGTAIRTAKVSFELPATQAQPDDRGKTGRFEFKAGQE